MCSTRSNAFEASKTQHAQMSHGLQSMKKFSTMSSLKTKLIAVCGSKERRDARQYEVLK